MYNVDRVNRMPFALHNGFHFIAPEGGGVLVRMELKPFHLNGSGFVHGGVVPIIADAAGASVLIRQTGLNAMTADLRINYIAVLNVGDVITAQGEVTHIEGKTAYCRVRVTDQNDRVVALAQLTCITKPRPESASSN